LANQPFLARLPMRLLSHPQGGALGVIGKVERMWAYSFSLGRVTDTNMFQDLLERIMTGKPLGYALSPVNQRYTALASELSERLQEMLLKNVALTTEINAMLTQTIDSRNYILLGDPAARLPVGEDGGGSARPALEDLENEIRIRLKK
jgi:hypothetical protein